MSQDLTGGFSSEEALKTILAAIGRLEKTVEDLGARAAALETATEARGKETRPILERILAELVAFKADTRAEFADTRTLFRQELGLETRNIHARLADIERRLSSVEERTR